MTKLDRIVINIVLVILCAFAVVALTGLLVCTHVITGPTWLVNL